MNNQNKGSSLTVFILALSALIAVAFWLDSYEARHGMLEDEVTKIENRLKLNNYHGFESGDKYIDYIEETNTIIITDLKEK